MKKNVLGFVAIIGLATVLTGCNSKEVWDVDYDLSTEMGHQLHCYAQFQKNVKADSYGAEWLNEVNNGFETMVEGKIKADDEEYNLVCNFSDDLGEFSINYTPIDLPEIGNPASEYCLQKGGSYAIVSNETNIYGECTLPDGSKCEQWALFYGECQNDSFNTEDFDLETELGRIEACADRVGFYINTNDYDVSWEEESEAGASFIRNGHIVYTKQGENAEDDVECIVDMVAGSVVVEFSNHFYNGELQEDTIIPDEPVAKMRVLEGETEEETMKMVENACSDMGGEWGGGSCNLDDGTVIAF